jgi:hypothetical protein
MVKYILKVVAYVAVVLGVVFGGAYCFSLEPRQVLVGSPTATYYSETGSQQGRTKQSGDKIEIYDRSGSYDGRVTFGGTVRFYDRAGAQNGHAHISGSKISIYNRNGAFVGSITKGTTSRFYDANGAANGWATTSGSTTVFYNSNGQRVGKKQ